MQILAKWFASGEKVRNRILTITKEDAKFIIEKYKMQNIFVTEIHGDKISELEDFFRDMSADFKFPDLFKKYRNMNAYLDL